ncbi:zinc finger protein OZF-like isoform X4 [Melanotaenia boesemani]|uniref:zinc finger protein OZF-like isoform X4 n=1 Tax=Melanotaenia boesemani TaxID=1250792 RepID=UPI001C05C6F0|nr:zinc finger protein OZF-like isoform X4 [Melanotaenia boesemani]
MSSVQHLREFISERLTAAAEEIFTEFEKTIVQYEEEIDRQRRLLDITWNPQIKLIRTDLPQQHVYKDEEVLLLQQPCDQERKPNLDQEEAEPAEIKDEQAELCASEEGEELVLKQETDTFMVTPVHQESDLSDAELNPDQLFSTNLPLTESQNQEGTNQAEVGSTPDVEMKTKKTRHRNNVKKSSSSESRFSTESDKKSLECDVCGKSFSKKFNMEQHYRIHTGFRPYACQTCGKSFTHKCNLLTHTRIHTGEKLYSCEICGKGFTYGGHLTVHRRTHTGEKPYACKVCGKSFAQKGNLFTHTKIHASEKQHSCKTCGKGFTRNDHLLVHMRIHTGEKPFSCSICGKSFIQSSVLMVHMRMHSGERPHPCGRCGKHFKHQSSLRIHMRTHTSEELYALQTTR